MPPKQNPSNSEALLLAHMKRLRAKAAMDQIVKRYGSISNQPEPGPEVWLDYLTNMVHALELLLKVMADDWRTPDDTQFSHRVGDMYQEIFGRPHPCPELMAVLRRAICNQKFLYEPADGILRYIPQLEDLWVELTNEFYKRHWMEDITVRCEVVIPPEVIDYLRANLHHFYLSETHKWQPPLPREVRIQVLEKRIQLLQSELERVQATDQPPEESETPDMERLGREYIERLQAAASCFDFNREVRKGEFSFGQLSFGKVLPGCLD
jgi:hypothetical protein